MQGTDHLLFGIQAMPEGTETEEWPDCALGVLVTLVYVTAAEIDRPCQFCYKFAGWFRWAAG